LLKNIEILSEVKHTLEQKVSTAQEEITTQHEKLRKIDHYQTQRNNPRITGNNIDLYIEDQTTISFKTSISQIRKEINKLPKRGEIREQLLKIVGEVGWNAKTNKTTPSTKPIMNTTKNHLSKGFLVAQGKELNNFFV
jgi:hypothetical protein